jgi:hypothetical protein
MKVRNTLNKKKVSLFGRIIEAMIELRVVFWMSSFDCEISYFELDQTGVSLPYRGNLQKRR